MVCSLFHPHLTIHNFFYDIELMLLFYIFWVLLLGSAFCSKILLTHTYHIISFYNTYTSVASVSCTWHICLLHLTHALIKFNMVKESRASRWSAMEMHVYSFCATWAIWVGSEHQSFERQDGNFWEYFFKVRLQNLGTPRDRGLCEEVICADRRGR